MQDLTQFLLSIPASGVRTIAVPYVYPSEYMEIQTNVNYLGAGGSAGTDVITLTGTGGAGQGFSGVIGGVPYSYASTVADSTLTLAATNGATYLKTIPGILGQVAITSGVGTITLTANILGPTSANIGVTAVGIGTLGASAATAALTAGTALTALPAAGSTGISTSYVISTVAGVYGATNVQSLVVAPATAGLNASGSRLFHSNDPMRVDAGNPTSILVTMTNLDATNAAVVTLVTEIGK